MAVTICNERIDGILDGKKLALFQSHLTPWRYGCVMFSDDQSDSIEFIFDITIQEESYKMECWPSDRDGFLEKKENILNKNDWHDISPEEWRTTGDLYWVFNLIATYIEKKQLNSYENKNY